MKNILIVLITAFIIVNPVYAEYDRMLEDDGSSTGGGANMSTVQKTNTSLLDAVKILFSGSPSATTDTNNTDNSTTNSGNTDNSSNDTNQNNVTNISSDITELLNNGGLTYPANITSAALNCLKNIGVYKQVQQSQGIPWQVLAGIHYREGGCNPNQSLVGGRVIGQPEPDVKNCSTQESGLGKPKALKQGGCGFDNLLDTATYAAIHLKSKIGGVPQSHAELVKALSKYNGGGNSNCRGGTNYAYCPPEGPGFDDAYVFSKNPDGKNVTMWLRFCGDNKKCNPPQIFNGIGVIPIAGAVNMLAQEQSL